MDKTMLRALLSARGLTFDQLKTTNPTLATEVSAAVRRAQVARLKQALRELPEPVRTAVEKLDPAEATGDAIQYLRKRLTEQGVDERHVAEVVERARRVKFGSAIDRGFIGSTPELAEHLATARMHEVVALAGLSGSTADTIARVVSAPSAVDDVTMGRLVGEKILNEAQARDLGFSAALYGLVDENTQLATAIRSTKLPTLGRAPTSTADLARLTAPDWVTFFVSSRVALPEGLTLQSAGESLAARFAALHPDLAMVARLPRVDVGQISGAVRVLSPLFGLNQRVIGARFEDLDTTGLGAEQIAQLARTHAELVQVVRTYPGLELERVLDDPKLGSERKVEIVARRTGFVHTLSEQLGETRFLRFDLGMESADIPRLGLAQLGASPDEQRMVLVTLRSYQRTWALTQHVDDAQTLLQSGFASAQQIGRESLSAFQAQSGLAAAKAKGVWEAARTSLADVTLTVGSILDILHGLFRNLGVGNQPASAEAYLRRLAGYEDLFGKLSFCDCEECQSILGPAAYFVDLMKYIDENLRTQFTGHPNHPLDLRTRRPDLWTIELSCKNTNDRVPTLDLVAEILENYIAQRAGYAGSLTDRAAVGERVYAQTLEQTVDSFHQPFCLPLARIGAYLATLGHTHAEVADALAATAPIRAQAELGLSARELQIVTTPDADLARLGHLYGTVFGGTATSVSAVDVQVLLAAMGIERNQLGELLATRFVAAGSASVTIKAAKRSTASVQNDVEWVNGLTADALDRMHRFTRLARRTGWSIPDLDLALATLAESALSPTGVENIAALHAVQARLAVTLAEACTLVGPIPQTPASASLFDRLFNPPSFVAADGAFPKPTTHFVHPAFRESTVAPVDPALPRLLTGLAVDLDGLEALARHLAPHLAQDAAPGFDPAAPSDDERYFVLSADNLGLLYRHARLSRHLNVSIDDLFQLLGFLGLDRVADLAVLRALLDLHAWWKGSGHALDDIAVATGQSPRNTSLYPDPTTVAAQVAAAASTALTFTDTVFAVALGTTELASRDLIASNPGVIESAAEGHWRLVAGIDLTAAVLSLPATATVPTPPTGTRAVTADEVREALRPYLTAEALIRSLGAELGVSGDRVAALAALAGQSLTADGVVRAVRGDGPIAPLAMVIAAVRPLAVALSGSAWDAAAIDFVHKHTALFGNEPLPHTTPDALHPSAPYLTLDQLRALSTYARFVGRGISELHSVLTGFDTTGPGFPSITDAAMARVLNVPGGLVVGLRGRVTLPATAPLALEQLDRAAQLALTLGVGGETLGALVATDYATLSRAADALVAAMSARHTNEAMRVAKLDEAEQPVREAKRDALAAYLIHSITPRVWSTLDELYQYFLIDVASGGCSTISRVVAATNSAQLYVHRAIMNLEQDDLRPTDRAHVALRMPADAAAEWSWRKNYRVWQANRKVFLWPENYLEPDLRDDKTPLFEELEQELLQTDIDDQSVLDAYTKYLTGLEELASLTIAGAYHDVRTPTEDTPTEVSDVLHLFGVTAGDPPTYYYRACENLIASGRDPNRAAVWSPWKKISVQITGRKVAPVVHKGRLHVFWIDVRTRSVNDVKDGASEFSGYLHTMSLKFTTLRPDGTWIAPQEVKLPANDYWFHPGRGQVEDLLETDIPPLDPTRHTHEKPIDDYTLSGPSWEGAWPDSTSTRLRLRFRNFLSQCDIDLFGRQAVSADAGFSPTPYPQLLCAKRSGSAKRLYYGTPAWMFWNAPGYANAVIDEERIEHIGLEVDPLKGLLQLGLYAEEIATIPADTQLLAIPGSEEDGILQVGNDVLLLQGSVTDDAGYVLRRLGTTVVEDIARRLFEDGLDGLLDTQTQLALAESGLPITRVGGRIQDRSSAGKLDFDGPYGIYYRELFFHIPFLIANALNSRSRFEAAQRWYHYIFDPTATEAIDVTGVPAADVAHRLLDRVWRYREFRGLDVARLRDILTDENAIALYKKDPFNPWAIARRRVSALQKAIVMKYVGNQLDWADSLFTQFTMESVNEALMVYIMASDVLGPRSTRLGDCGEGISPSTYEKIGPLVDGSSEILVELETWILGRRFMTAGLTGLAGKSGKYTIDHSAIAHAVARKPLTALVARGFEQPEAAARHGMPTRQQSIATTATEVGIFRGQGWNEARTASWGPALGNATIKTRDKLGGRSFDHSWKLDASSWIGRFGWSLVRQLTPAFCVPANADLLAYWDRVEDRLYKIRHCMDIDGQKRELALFAPPINPMQLVSMKAAGLGLSDILGATSGNLPPYRFVYLLDRAKAFAASLSGFGAALLSAVEKKDAEQLNRLRITQQMNLAQLTTQSRRLEIQVASEALASLRRQREAVVYRKEFYGGLISQDRNDWEIAESVTRHLGSALQLTEATIDTAAAIFSALPQVGSPFAMKYGGVELGNSTRRFGNAISAIAQGMNAISASMALEGNFARRREGWKNQETLADHDLASLDRQIAAAELRLEIVNQALATHEKSLDQIQEMLDLTDGKFTNLGLYTWMATQLQRLYRSAYQNALALAKLAEQAYRFERGDDTSAGLLPSYWDSTHAGLLSGEPLLLALQTLERRYLETNYRAFEVDQAFALSQIAPHALVALRETGRCTFTASEVFFDLFYPGHYKRRIKGVRLTMPCITGPYVNVSATLNLQRSWIRPTPTPGAALVEVPPSRSVAIATSTAQNDAGVFELSFRDERYMPFEGLGAISEWSLELPGAFRQFDYQTINDVILSISYTAEQDGVLRERVETQNAALEGGILHHFRHNSARRLFSLRQDFSSAFTRLLRSSAGTQVKIEIGDRHFPLFFRGRALEVQRGAVLLRTASGTAPANFKLGIDGTTVEAFAADPTLANLPGKALPGAFTGGLYAQHTLVIETAGNLAPASLPPGDTSALDAAALLDILIFVEYRLA